MDKPRICVVAFPRSGSTLFIQLLGSVAPVRIFWEIFHPNAQVAIEGMVGMWPKVAERLEGTDIEVTPAGVKKRPQLLLDTLQSLAGGRPIAFKVFPQHLPRPALAGLLHSVIPVFLFRNLLDAYISQKIAGTLGKWAGENTSEICVEFEDEGFVRYALFVTRFMRFALEQCFKHNQPYLWYDYTEFSQLGFGRRLALDLGVAFPDIRFDVSGSEPGIRKQDLRTSPLSKLTNPDHAERFLVEHRMTELLDSTLRQDFLTLAGRLELVAKAYGWHIPKK